MTWSVRIGRFFGIDVFLHFTFVLMLIWIVGDAYYRTGSLWQALDRLIFVVLVFTIVVLHEYGHALTARLFGIKTQDIILLPIGGVARLESIPQKPWQEFLIAIAGPAVNFALANMCIIYLTAADLLAPARPAPAAAPEAMQALFDGPMLWRLFIVNWAIILFNMVPAFPMDGGRVLRSLLAMALDYVQATWIAARIGQAMAVLIALLGLMNYDFMLVLVALFVWTGALQEAKFASVRASLQGLTARQAMTLQFLTLYPFDTLETASLKLVASPQLAFPVLHGDVLVGMISRHEISSAMTKLGGNRHISEVMRRQSPVARPDDPLLNLLPVLQRGKGALPVIEGDQLIGLITIHEVAARLQRAGA